MSSHHCFILLFLCNLKVKNHVFPSILDTLEMWKPKFGFKEHMNWELRRELSSYNILMFSIAFKLLKFLPWAHSQQERVNLTLYISRAQVNCFSNSFVHEIKTYKISYKWIQAYHDTQNICHKEVGINMKTI